MTNINSQGFKLVNAHYKYLEGLSLEDRGRILTLLFDYSHGRELTKELLTDTNMLDSLERIIYTAHFDVDRT